MRRLTHLIVLVAFVFSCGGQWTALECLAWANMIREYSQVVPLQVAVKMTLSGDYPCSICKALAEKRSADQQKALGFDKSDKKFVTTDAVALASPEPSDFRYLSSSAAFRSRTETPPVPPPRSVLS